MGPNSGSANNLNRTPNQQPGMAEVGNQLPQYNVDPTTTLNSGAEHLNQAPLGREQLAIAEQLAQPSQAIPVATPVQQPAAQPDPVMASRPTTTTTVDAEQMEKVWVGKAQQAIAKDKDDPYELAHQIALLMKGYLRERYGKIIGKSDQGADQNK